MAHFAELNSNNVVQRVIVVHNNELLDEHGVEQEQNGIDFCVAHYGGTWIQTSYNNTFRGKLAIIGETYDPILNVFIPFKPFDSWSFDVSLCAWMPPILPPPDEKGFGWIWDENSQGWVKVPMAIE